MEANGTRLAHVLYNLLEATRICGILLTPFMPESCGKLFDQIGACEGCRTWDSAASWGKLKDTVTVTKGEALFPRIDTEKALEELDALSALEPYGIPVTAKFRSGWDDASVNAVEFATLLEDAGAAALGVHGRTAVQLYRGQADWDVIAQVAADEGYIQPADIEKLIKFRNNPSDESWIGGAK